MPGNLMHTVIPLLVSCGNVYISIVVVAGCRIFLLFLLRAVGAAIGVHDDDCDLVGNLTIGREPISCSSKHSSASGFVTMELSVSDLPNVFPGSETVADE